MGPDRRHRQRRGYDNIDPEALSERLNYLVHGAWFRDHVNPTAADTDVLRKRVLRQGRHLRLATTCPVSGVDVGHGGRPLQQKIRHAE